MKKRKKKNTLVGVCVIVVTVVVVICGMTIWNKKEDKMLNSHTFATEPEITATQSPAKFDSFELSTAPSPDDFASPASSTTTGDTTSGNTTTVGSTSGSGVNTSSTTAGTTPGTTLHSYGEGENYAYAYAGFKPTMAKTDIADWGLILVNRNYILPQDYSPELAEAAKGTGVRMDARVAPHYQQMYDAAKKDGITLTPLSGHRRISTQKTNFENKIQKYRNQGYDRVKATQLAAEIILPPGTSEHNAGLAMDIISLDVEFEETKEFRWLQEHAEDYGFILRYPKDKEAITEITYEPWHWRYVGIGNAKAINQSGLCLEEYVAKLGR